MLRFQLPPIRTNGQLFHGLLKEDQKISRNDSTFELIYYNTVNLPLTLTRWYVLQKRFTDVQGRWIVIFMIWFAPLFVHYVFGPKKWVLLICQMNKGWSIGISKVCRVIEISLWSVQTWRSETRQFFCEFRRVERFIFDIWSSIFFVLGRIVCFWSWSKSIKPI